MNNVRIQVECLNDSYHRPLQIPFHSIHVDKYFSLRRFFLITIYTYTYIYVYYNYPFSLFFIIIILAAVCMIIYKSSTSFVSFKFAVTLLFDFDFDLDFVPNTYNSQSTIFRIDRHFLFANAQLCDYHQRRTQIYLLIIALTCNLYP